jgi:hypothetical protein
VAASISGTAQIDVRASVATVIIGGSVATATTNSSVMLLNGANAIGSVTALQGTNPWIITGSVQGSFSPAANQSVSGTVDANVLNTNLNVGGSVVAFQSNPSVHQTLAGLMSTNASVITGGGAAGNSSVQVLNFPANQSVSGTVGGSIIGTVPVTQAGTWIASTYGVIQGYNQNITSVSGSPVYVAGRNQDGSVGALYVVASALQIFGSVSGTVNVGNTNVNVGGSVVAFQGTTPWVTVGSVYQGTGWSGSVVAFQAGTQITSLVSTVPSSVLIGASMFGQLPAGTAPLGSVATLQGTNPWNIAGSVAAFVVGNASLITVAQGSVAATVINVPQVSVHGTVKIFPASVISGHGSVNGAASVALLAAPGSGLRNYVMEFTLANTGANTTLVTFTDGDASIIGRAIAPAGGGSNAVFATPMVPSQNKVVNMVAATATSVLYGWIGGYNAP